MNINDSPQITKSELREIPLQAQIGKEIRKWRRAKGINQTNFAELCGTSQSALAQIEAGRGNPTVQTLDRILHVLGKRAQIRFLPALPLPSEIEPASNSQL